MKWTFVILIVLLLATAAVWKLRRPPTPSSKQSAPAAAASGAPAAAPAEKDPGFIGVILAGDWVQVEPNISGRIVNVLVKPGQEVRAGTPIAELDVQSMK